MGSLGHTAQHGGRYGLYDRRHLAVLPSISHHLLSGVPPGAAKDVESESIKSCPV
jgi:hypothetical protein